jgi:hypothetical protein
LFDLKFYLLQQWRLGPRAMNLGRSFAASQLSVAIMLRLAPSRPKKVVLAGNIGQLCYLLGQRGEGLSLQKRRMTDDDLCAALAPQGRPKRVP